MRLASRGDLRALFHRLLDEAQDLVALPLVDHGADDRILIARVAPLEALRPRGEPGHVFLVQTAVDQMAVDAHADLALVNERAEDSPVDRALEVRVLQHDVHVVPAQFHGGASEDGSRLACDLLAHFRAAGKGHDARLGMARYAVADLTALSREDAQEPLG